jgi:hypothetical protein
VSAPEIHTSLDHLAGLLGTWSGEGTGQYPTIEDFSYREELVFGHGGKPFLTYAQRTWSSTGAPLHVETGYIRCPDADRVEFVVAQPTGVAEVHEGTLRAVGDAVEVDLATTSVGLTATAKPVTAVRRRFRLDGDRLEVALDMAAVGRELSLHLESRLTRN